MRRLRQDVTWILPRAWTYAYYALQLGARLTAELMVSAEQDETAKGDAYFRRMVKWVVIALIATIVLAIVVVELTLRLLNQ